jgi:hypothetical protein
MARRMETRAVVPTGMKAMAVTVSVKAMAAVMATAHFDGAGGGILDRRGDAGLDQRCSFSAGAGCSDREQAGHSGKAQKFLEVHVVSLFTHVAASLLHIRVSLRESMNRAVNAV